MPGGIEVARTKTNPGIEDKVRQLNNEEMRLLDSVEFDKEKNKQLAFECAAVKFSGISGEDAKTELIIGNLVNDGPLASLSRDVLSRANTVGNSHSPISLCAGNAGPHTAGSLGISKERKRLYGDTSAGLIMANAIAKSRRLSRNQYFKIQYSKQSGVLFIRKAKQSSFRRYLFWCMITGEWLAISIVAGLFGGKDNNNGTDC